MGSSPASPESWPCDGSITSGVPKKTRHCDQAGAMLMDIPRGREKDLMAHQVRRTQRSRSPESAHELGGTFRRELRSPLVTPMSEVTRILSAIEDGDARAPARLLPLVYDELRKLAAQKLAQEKPGQTLDATSLVHEAYLRLVGDESE